MTIKKIRAKLAESILKVSSNNFEELSIELFRYQAQYNPLYAQFIELLGIKIDNVSQLVEIPFLPIQFFKNYTIQTGSWEAEAVFSSSGTTGMTTSRHLLRSTKWYQDISRRCFQQFYKFPSQYCFLALLPSYLERTGSSLISMAEDFIQQSRYDQSGFFLNHQDKLIDLLEKNKKEGVPTILIGVSFALLDFAESQPMDLGEIIIMETGGMKGRRKELTRVELHQQLKTAFNVTTIHSEYGMTELTSQAYSKGEGIFYPGPTMKVMTREINDPFKLQLAGKSGILNIIDLGNLDTCAFIATDDIGRVYEDGSFEVMGRVDYSDLRGCNLLVVE